MNPYWGGLARRNWQTVAALVVGLLFALVQLMGFGPLLAYYRNDVRQAVDMGVSLDGTAAATAVSVHLTALLPHNSLPAVAAEKEASSGALTANLLDDVTRWAAQRGLEVVGTEQGAVTQLPANVLVRARVRLRGHYGSFLDLLGDMANARSLIAVDRFSIQQAVGDRQDIEIWISQLFLKRTRGGP